MSRNPPSPKRRRTDNGPVSAESIAQANSTLQVFAGQRQNRWMQGTVPPWTTGEDASRTQAASMSGRGTVNGQEQNLDTTMMNFPESDARSSLGPVTFSSQAPIPVGTAERATATPANLPTNTPNIVSYQSLTTLRTPGNAEDSGSTKSLERMARTATQPSLPSPAPSDENANSPTVGAPASAMPATSMNNPDAGLRGPGPPPANHVRNFGDGTVTGNGSPAPRMHNRVPSQQHRQQGTGSRAPSTNANTVFPNTFFPSLSAAHSPPGRDSPVLPSHPSAPPNQLSNCNTYFPLDMRQRLDTFQTKKLVKHKASEPDNGRLAVLRDAIDKQDWFYIVLSQIHSLTETPTLLPQCMAGLDPRAIAYLDNLVCPNKAISPVVLKWLADFPSPIMSVYSSPATRDLYEKLVGTIRGFLERLPMHWDHLVSESKVRLAPPLAQDLFETFGLQSPVLQTTAFRAIARMLFNHPADHHGLEQLEILHSWDQVTFFHGLRRSAHEKSLAYFAYRKTLEAWTQHKSRVRSNEIRQQQLPPEQRCGAPAFIVPFEAAAIFQPRQVQGVPTPQGNAPASTLQRHAQQYQNMTTNHALIQKNQMASNGRGPPLQAAQNPTMQQRPPTAVQNGNMALPIPRQQHPPGPKLVFPHETEQPRAQPTQPDTTRTALHQAHLRSPELGPAQPKPDALRLYRHVIAWALSPSPINKDVPVNVIEFNLPQKSFALVPLTLPSEVPGEPPTRNLTEASQTYRLRCCAITPGGFPNEVAWVGADNFWPDNLFVDFNGVMLETRRKLHHGRYLPIDLTSYIKPGINKLTAIVNRMSTDTRPFEYAVAIEMVGVIRHESITGQVPKITAAESLASIKESLAGTSKNDDIEITSSNLTIKLFDPYSGAKIFDTPVRGIGCAHRDCFDLEIFLGLCKREQPGWPTVVDCWRCPLCRGDVRPQNLIIDGFLVEVREELAKRNLLDTRAIVVEADGTWKPKKEEITGVRSASLEREEQRHASAARRTSSKKPVEVVEID